jgi:hypothetical protein
MIIIFVFKFINNTNNHENNNNNNNNIKYILSKFERVCSLGRRGKWNIEREIWVTKLRLKRRRGRQR